MNNLEIFLWTCIISSGVVLFGYEIWNFIVVSKNLASLSKDKE